jgi:DNA-binding transcriptional ArsR family regulator
MPGKESFRSLLHFAVTPRFEVFYALRTLGERDSFAKAWRRQTEKALPADFGAGAERVAPRPMIWALLADSLRDSKADPTFPEMLETIASLDDEMFQRAVLSGVFRSEGVVTDLIAGRRSLSDAVAGETEKSRGLLGHIGLQPFKRSGAVAGAFTRIVSEPTEFRTDLSNTLETFWTSAFCDEWKSLEPLMRRRVEAMENANASNSHSLFAGAAKLPVIFDDEKRTVSSARGAAIFRYRDLREIHVIPSAFNDSRLWGAYTDSSGSLRLYFPVFDAALLEESSVRVRRPLARNVTRAADPALLFRALGDTTRYAMARVLARGPRTSVELAKDFAVSKATISHHVQLLRQAGLLHEQSTEKGVALALDRQALEDLASEAAPAIFASDQPLVIKRSRHENGKRK